VTYYNKYEYYDSRVYQPEPGDLADRARAQCLIREWDYNSDARIPLGVLYKAQAPVFDESFAREGDRAIGRESVLKNYLGRM
jgi:2-oxoglutarate ferredoxin oxidoreductase subunit beta